MVTGLDHVAVVVSDLDAAVAGYTALLGREASHADGDGARRAWFRLANMSLEVISPDGAGPAGDRVRARLDSHGEGMWALAFAVDDLEAARRLMKRRGVTASEPAPLASPEGGRLASRLDPEATGGVQSILVGPGAGPPAPSTTLGDENAVVSSLDHVVVSTKNPDRAAAIYGARLGLDLRLDRSNPDWGQRLMFFRCGDLVVEIAANLKDGVSDAPDGFYGLSWRVPDIRAARERLAAAGLNVSDVRTGRRRGTEVFTVRDAPGGVPTLVICVEGASEV